MLVLIFGVLEEACVIEDEDVAVDGVDGVRWGGG